MLAEIHDCSLVERGMEGRHSITTLICDDFIYITKIFRGTTKDSHLDAMEILYKETKEGNLFNDKHTVGPSPVFDVITQYITQP
jgi:hypothetical protein